VSGTFVVVSLGTYHLPFTRLVEWIEPWIAANPAARVLVQHGPTRAATGAENRRMVPYAELLDHFRRADAVVLQGGAGGIQDLRGLDRKPIVVPRVPGSGEVVDDHQLRFTQEAERLGLIHRALDAATLSALLDAAVAGRLETRLPATLELPGADAVAGLLSEPPPPLPRSERLRRLGRSARGILGDLRR